LELHRHVLTFWRQVNDAFVQLMLEYYQSWTLRCANTFFRQIWHLRWKRNYH